jgi:lysozyme family protein
MTVEVQAPKPQPNQSANARLHPCAGFKTKRDFPMSSSHFEACLREVLKHEGGFVNHPKDPGGATNMGITKATLEQFRGRKVSVDEVKTLTREEAARIYRLNYWDVIKGDALPAGINLCVFDCAVNSGPHRALKFLKETMNDRAVLPESASRIQAYTRYRLRFLIHLSTWPTFGRGWLKRVKAIEKKALSMADQTF